MTVPGLVLIALAVGCMGAVSATPFVEQHPILYVVACVIAGAMCASIEKRIRQ